MSSNFLVNVYGLNTDVLSLINTKSVTTVEINTQAPTNQKYNVTFNRQVAIRTGDISVGLNGYCLNGEQKYTFGPPQNPLWVCSHEGTTYTLSISTNGTTWAGLNQILTTGYTVCYNGKIWVAGGFSSTTIYPLAYSWNGLNWTGCGSSIFTTNANAGCSCVTWNGTMFIAGGFSSGTNVLAYSYDGINWVGLGGASIFSSAVRDIAWNGKLWVAVGYGTTNKAAYSTDGINWTASTSSFGTSAAGLFAVVWNGLRWIIGGSGNTPATLWYSIDGINWTAVSNSTSYISSYCCGLSWNGILWTAAGSTYGTAGTNNMAYTQDPLGQSGWVGLGSPVIPANNNGFITNIKWNGRYFIGTGGNNGNNIYYSYNGITWVGNVLSSMPAANYSRCVEFNSRRPHSITIPRYMIVAGSEDGTGTNTLVYSYDGTTWTGLGKSIFSTSCLCIKFNGKIWVAGGSGGNSLAYSYDGINWTGLGTQYFNSRCFGLCWNGTLWTAVGAASTNNAICVSYDGILWIPVLAPNTIFDTARGPEGVACSNSMIIATGRGIVTGNNIAYSYNGFQWFSTNQTAFSTTGSEIFGICWNGSIWVAVGTSTNFSIAYSYDGIVWTGVAGSKSIFTGYGYGIAWNGQLFIATGDGTNFGAYSFNGINWTSLGAAPNPGTGAYGINWDGTRWHVHYIGTTLSGYSYSGTSGWINYTNLFGTAGRCFESTYGAKPNVYIQHPTVAVGAGLNTLAYSEDGITWRGLGSNIFESEGYNVAWNGSLWIAVGLGSNTMAYSQDGIQWTGLGKTIFSTSGNGIGWNGTYWVATGTGANTIAYSQNGTIWFGLGSSVFTQSGRGIAWNGNSWVATGQGTNTLAYSSNSITWTGIGSSTFSTSGYAVATNGIYWVATGQGSNCMAYTTNITGSSGWTKITGVFDTTGFVGTAYGIAWNGQTWVVVGQPAGSSTNEIAYSTNGTTWTGVSVAPFTTAGLGVCWNGVRFIATGYGGGNSIAYSPDGINWYRGFNGYSTGSTSQIFTSYGNAVASNPGVGAVPIESQMILNPSINGQSSLDIVAPAYYQPGYSGMSVKIEQNNFY